MRSLPEERISNVLSRADENGSEDVSVALAIAERNNVELPKEYRLRVCNSCKRLLHPGRNCRVRTDGSVKIECISCGEVNRHGF